MKIVKLLENITKGKIENNTRIKLDNDMDIIYKYDDALQKTFFTDISGKEIDIMNFFECDFELVVENQKKDIWDQVYNSLNSNNNSNSNIEKGIGISTELESNIQKFSISRLKTESNSDSIRLYNIGDDELRTYNYEEDQISGFYNTAEGYFDVALAMIEDYKKRFEIIYDIGDLNKNAFSFGYYQDSIIKTLLAFSCECYLKSLLLNQGKSMQDIKKLSHGLVDLYNALDEDTFSDIFLDMEKNGYVIYSYNSPNLPFDNPDLTEKFMLELGLVDDAFVDSRYCAEKDKNTNYSFLYKLASSLKNIASKKIEKESIFSEGKSIN